MSSADLDDEALMEGIPDGKPGEPAWAVARMYPLQGGWTEEEFFQLDLTCGFELTHGMLSCKPMTTPMHQLILQFLFESLRAYLQEHPVGYVFFAPLIIRLEEEVLRQPDVTFLRPERIKDAHTPPLGADLVMEVVSPGTRNRNRDWKKKRKEYAKAGITEYWIVDPQTDRIQVLSFNGSNYDIVHDATLGDIVESRLLAGFRLSVDDVFKAGHWPPLA